MQVKRLLLCTMDPFSKVSFLKLNSTLSQRWVFSNWLTPFSKGEPLQIQLHPFSKVNLFKINFPFFKGSGTGGRHQLQSPGPHRQCPLFVSTTGGCSFLRGQGTQLSLSQGLPSGCPLNHLSGHHTPFSDSARLWCCPPPCLLWWSNHPASWTMAAGSWLPSHPWPSWHSTKNTLWPSHQHPAASGWLHGSWQGFLLGSPTHCGNPPWCGPFARVLPFSFHSHLHPFPKVFPLLMLHPHHPFPKVPPPPYPSSFPPPSSLPPSSLQLGPAWHGHPAIASFQLLLLGWPPSSSTQLLACALGWGTGWLSEPCPWRCSCSFSWSCFCLFHPFPRVAFLAIGHCWHLCHGCHGLPTSHHPSPIPGISVPGLLVASFPRVVISFPGVVISFPRVGPKPFSFPRVGTIIISFGLIAWLEMLPPFSSV